MKSIKVKLPGGKTVDAVDNENVVDFPEAELHAQELLESAGRPLPNHLK